MNTPDSPVSVVRGEEVTLPGDASHGDPTLPGYAAIAPGARRGVVVIHEIFGRQPEVDRVVDRFARAGYAAVAPDLFAHGRLACIRATFGAMKTGEDIAPVRAARRARTWLCERAGLAPDRVALIGFCFGGGFALLAGVGWAAVSTNYGEVPPEERLRGLGPTHGCYGGRDVLFRGKADVLRARLTRVGVEHTVRVYPEAGHAFLTDGDYPIASALSWPLMHVRYDPAVAEEGWRDILAFFDQHLGVAEMP